jgi:hypothetical protein
MTMSRAPLSLGLALALALATAACGGDDKNYGDPIVNATAETQALAAVEAAASLSTLESDPDNDIALVKVNQLYAAAQAMLNAKLAATSGNRKPAPGAALAAKPLDAACVVVATGRVTYTNCDFGAGTINGTVSWGGGSFSVDLVTTLDTDDSSFTVSQRGSIAVSATAISGGLDIAVDGSFQDVSFDWNISSDFDIVLAAGKATSGVLEVHGDWSVRAPQGSADYDVWVKAEFDGTTVTIY